MTEEPNGYQLGGHCPSGLVSVSKKYGTIQALADVSVTLAFGVTVLLGSNGAGKSTLCRILAGAEDPDTGHILRNGDNVVTRFQHRQHKRSCGWLPQGFGAPPGITVRQLVSYAAWLKEIPAVDADRHIDESLQAVDMFESSDRKIGQLSGGMLRRVGIAQAIVHGPDLIVLDEPSAGLDPAQRDSFHELMKDLAHERIILLSTHLLEDVAAVAQRTFVLERGSIIFEGETMELVEQGKGGDLSAQLRSAFVRLKEGKGPT